MKKLSVILGIIFLITLVSATIYQEPWSQNQDGDQHNLTNMDYIIANYFNGEVIGSMDWTNLKNYPVACPGSSAITGLNDSVTCSDLWVDTAGDTWTGSMDGGGNNLTNVDSISADRINEVLYVQAGNGSDIQAKIDKCSSDGCEVVIPTGSYTLTDNEIQLIDNLRITGFGHPKIYLNDTTFNHNFFTLTNKSNIHISGIEFIDLSGTTKSVIYTGGGSSDVHIYNNVFTNFTFGYCVFIRGFNNGNNLPFSENIMVYNNNFFQNYVKNSTYAPRAVYFDGGTKNSVVYSNYIESPTGDNNRGIEFDGDYIPLNYGENNHAYDNIINGSHVALMMENNRKSSFYNNKIYDSWRGIWLYSSLIDVKITDNYCLETSSQACIHYDDSGVYALGSPNNILIENNFLQTTTNNAILIEAPANNSIQITNLTIKGNTIYNPGRTPISIGNNISGVAIDNVIIAGTNWGSYSDLTLLSVNYNSEQFINKVNIKSANPFLKITNTETDISDLDTLFNLSVIASDSSTVGSGEKGRIELIANQQFAGNHASTLWNFYIFKYVGGGTDIFSKVLTLTSDITGNTTIVQVAEELEVGEKTTTKNLDVSEKLYLNESTHYIHFNGTCIIAVGTGQTGACL